MTPEQRSAYDGYIVWMTHLVGIVDAVKAIPLDELVAANMRMTLVGGRVDAEGVEAADPVALERQLRLVEHAIVFRDAVMAPAGEAGEPA
jgi:hypothetical protein